MSLLNLSVFKKHTTAQDNSLPFCGFSVTETTVESPMESLNHCLIKGLFIFAASFGF